MTLPARTDQHTPPSPFAAYAVYGLYLVSTVTVLPMLIGALAAYVCRDGAPDWLATHYRYQIRTFWITWVYLLACGVMACFLFPFIWIFGLHVFWLLPIWIFLRCLVGLQALHAGRPVERPASWLV